MPQTKLPFTPLEVVLHGITMLLLVTSMVAAVAMLMSVNSGFSNGACCISKGCNVAAISPLELIQELDVSEGNSGLACGPISRGATVTMGCDSDYFSASSSNTTTDCHTQSGDCDAVDYKGTVTGAGISAIIFVVFGTMMMVAFLLRKRGCLVGLLFLCMFCTMLLVTILTSIASGPVLKGTEITASEPLDSCTLRAKKGNECLQSEPQRLTCGDSLAPQMMLVRWIFDTGSVNIWMIINIVCPPVCFIVFTIIVVLQPSKVANAAAE